MAEILAAGAAVGTVVQLGDYAYRFSTRLLSYTNSVHRADKTLSNIANEISSTKTVLNGLLVVLDEGEKASWTSDSDDASPRARNITKNKKSFISSRCMEEIKWAIGEITSVFDEIRDMMERSLGVSMTDVKPSSNSGEENDIFGAQKHPGRASIQLGNPKKLKFPFKEPKLNLLREQLSHLKSELMLKLQVLTTVRDFKMRKGSHRLIIKREECKRLAESNFILRQNYEKLQKEYECQRQEFGSVPVTNPETPISSGFIQALPNSNQDLYTASAYRNSESLTLNLSPSTLTNTTVVAPPTIDYGESISALMLGELFIALNLVWSMTSSFGLMNNTDQLPVENMKAFEALRHTVWHARSLERVRLLKLSTHLAWKLEECEMIHMRRLRTLIQQLIKDLPEQEQLSRKFVPEAPILYCRRPSTPYIPSLGSLRNTEKGAINESAYAESYLEPDEGRPRKMRINPVMGKSPWAPQEGRPESPTRTLPQQIMQSSPRPVSPALSYLPVHFSFPQTVTQSEFEATVPIVSDAPVSPHLSYNHGFDPSKEYPPVSVSWYPVRQSPETSISPLPARHLHHLHQQSAVRQPYYSPRAVPSGSSSSSQIWPQSNLHLQGCQAPSSRPAMSRRSSTATLTLSSMDRSALQFPFHHHPERSPDPLPSVASLHSSASYSSPPPPDPHAHEGNPGSASSAGPSDQYSEAPAKRTRGRPRKIRPEVEPKPPKVSLRQPHNVVERKYREGLNKDMERLRSAIPNLEGTIGSAAGNKASKASVLQSAVEEIEMLRKEKQKLKDDLQTVESDLDKTKRVLENLERRISSSGTPSPRTEIRTDVLDTIATGASVTKNSFHSSSSFPEIPISETGKSHILNLDSHKTYLHGPQDHYWDHVAKGFMLNWTTLDESEINVIMSIGSNIRKRKQRYEDELYSWD